MARRQATGFSISLARARHLPPFTLILSLSIPLFLSLYSFLCHSVPYRCFSRVRSARSLFLPSLRRLSLLCLFLSLSLSISLVLTPKSRSSSSTSHHIHTGSTSAFSLSLSICRLATPCILRERAEDSLIYIPWPMTLGRPRNDLHRRVSKIR